MSKNGCEVCGEKDQKVLCVDHDHSCCPGKNSCGNCIRGILCHSCNLAEGNLRSSLDLAEKMVSYIKRYGNYND